MYTRVIGEACLRDVTTILGPALKFEPGGEDRGRPQFAAKCVSYHPSSRYQISNILPNCLFRRNLPVLYVRRTVEMTTLLPWVTEYVHCVILRRAGGDLKYIIIYISMAGNPG